MKFSFPLMGFACCLIFLICTTSVKADFSDLVRQVPETANKLSMVDVLAYEANASDAVEAAVDQALGTSEALPLIAPWKPTKIVTAAEMDIKHMAPIWQMAAIEFQDVPDLADLAKRGGGIVETLSGQQVAWLENAGVMMTGDKTITIVTPLNRQSAARWLSRTKSRRGNNLSPYLAQAVEELAGNGEIIEIFDLTNLFEPTSVRAAVQANPMLSQVNPDPTNLLVGIRGLSVTCSVKDNSMSMIKFDFGSPVAPLASIAKPFMLGALSKAGAMLDEFDSWKFSSNNKRLMMMGQLTPDGVARIAGLVGLSPVRAHHDAANDIAMPSQTPVDPPTTPPKQSDNVKQSDGDRERVARASRNYYRRLKSSVDGISRGVDLDRMDRSALWVTNQVRNLESMTTRNVDPEMVQASQQVIEGLRNIVYEFQNADIRQQERLNPVGRFGRTRITAVPMRGRWGRAGVNYGGHRIYNYAPMVSQDLYLGGGPAEKQAIRDREGFNAGQNARTTMQQIQQQMTAIEQRMMEKYGDLY